MSPPTGGASMPWLAKGREELERLGHWEPVGQHQQLLLGSGEPWRSFQMGDWWHMVDKPCVKALP